MDQLSKLKGNGQTEQNKNREPLPAAGTLEDEADDKMNKREKRGEEKEEQRDGMTGAGKLCTGLV